MIGDLWGHIAEALNSFALPSIGVDWSWWLANKWARALGMLLLVWATIWVIALVYNGYAQDTLIGPVGLRPHTNRRLGENTIVFDQSRYPHSMDGVEATCSVFFQYDDSFGKTRTIPVSTAVSLKLHIRVSPIPAEGKARYGFEITPAVAELAQASVTYPTIETTTAPEQIGATPDTVGAYVELHKLTEKWTEDDDAPIISIGPTLLEVIEGAREEHVLNRATAWQQSQQSGLVHKMCRTSATRERANAFGSYYLKMKFSKRPDFVLFKHPNKELKMTAWLTVLTSIFALLMDLWPVDGVEKKAVAAEPARAQKQTETLAPKPIISQSGR